MSLYSSKPYIIDHDMNTHTHPYPYPYPSPFPELAIIAKQGILYYRIFEYVSNINKLMCALLKLCKNSFSYALIVSNVIKSFVRPTTETHRSLWSQLL